MNECPITGQEKDCDECPLNIKNKEEKDCEKCTYKKISYRK